MDSSLDYPTVYPGPKSAAALARMSRLVVTEPLPFVLDLAASRGMWLATIDGQRLFDWAGYYASKLIGHNHPRLLEPDYTRRLVTAANNKIANPDFLTLECLEYYELLYSLAPVCMRNEQLEVYALNSGAEAVENMLKYFIVLKNRKLLQAGRQSGTHRLIYFDQAFHGRTIYTLNVTELSHDPIATKDFHGFAPGNVQVAFPAIDTSRPDAENRARTARSLEVVEETLKRYGGEVVGVVVEPIQGAGGHRVAEPEFFRQLSVLTHKYDVSLGFDEVQTAGGAVGTFFAIDQYDLPHPPRAVAAAKKLGNGVIYMLKPMEDVGVLDSTWGGSLADMVRFVQEMKIVREEGLIEAVPAKTARLLAGLNTLAATYPDTITNVRGMGLYQGFSFQRAEDKRAFQRYAMQREDLLLLGAGTHSIRLRPNLEVTPEEIDLLLEKMERGLAVLEKSSAGKVIP